MTPELAGRVAIRGRAAPHLSRDREDLLFEHPKVRQVAVVPVADAKLGERVCAVVVPSDRGAPPTLEELAAFLATRELSRRKFPERLEVVDELPTTSSGKVQKHVLRDAVAAKGRSA
jgi:cyclohexanecarboxylate-CoA ligase